MFTGYKTANTCCFRIDYIEEIVCFLLEVCNADLVITDNVDMKVTITCMSETFNLKSHIFTGFIYKFNIWSNLVKRNNNVTFVE